MTTPSGKTSRFAWESLVLLILVAAGTGFHLWKSREWATRTAEVEKRCESELVANSRQLYEKTRQIAAKETETAVRSFAAGLLPALRGGRPEDLDAAVGEVIKIADVTFVHVLAADGEVVATSDRKLAVTGQAGPRAEWALETEDFRIREGAPGVTEGALAVTGPSEERRILWMGYYTGEPASEEEDTHGLEGLEL